jgi:hypothetical protein
VIARTITLDRIDQQQVLVNLGYGKKNPPTVAILERVEDLIRATDTCLAACSVQAGIISREQDALVTTLGRINSPTFVQVAAGATAVHYCLVTAGLAMDRRLQNCSDTVDCLLIDAIGSVLVEQGVEDLCHQLADEGAAYVSLPFSPGYCDCALAEQASLFAVMEKNPIGVNYHPTSFMMSPIKTVSFVAATGPDRLATNPCSLCRVERCQMRRPSAQVSATI